MARQKRIEFLRGEVRDDLRVRKPLASGKPNVLGDIVNSSLVRVKGGLYRASAADKLEGSTAYAAFAAKQAAKEMLYVGANDGMLHAFDAASGKEEFAFIPSGVKDSLNVLASRYGAGGAPHRYFVDGTPVVRMSTSATPGTGCWSAAWARAGGRSSRWTSRTPPPRLLWEFGVEQDERMGYSMPAPVVARLNDAGRSKGRWVVFLSNGYQASNSTSGESSLFVLDVSSGEVIRRFDFAAGMTAAELNALPAPKTACRVPPWWTTTAMARWTWPMPVILRAMFGAWTWPVVPAAHGMRNCSLWHASPNAAAASGCPSPPHPTWCGTPAARAMWWPSARAAS